MASPVSFLQCPAMENGEKSKSEGPDLESHCWYIDDNYLNVCVSIIICHEDLHRTNFSMFLTVLVIKKNNNETQIISVAAIIEYDMEAIEIVKLLLKSKLLVINLSRFSTIKTHVLG